MKKLIEQYIELAIKHGECTLEGDSSNGNKVHSKMMKIIDIIKSESTEVRIMFYETLNHKNDSVKIWTACTLLKTIETESISTLKNIAETNETILGLTADATLDCWEKGMITNIVNWNE